MTNFIQSIYTFNRKTKSKKCSKRKCNRPRSKLYDLDVPKNVEFSQRDRRSKPREVGRSQVNGDRKTYGINKAIQTKTSKMMDIQAVSNCNRYNEDKFCVSQSEELLNCDVYYHADLSNKNSRIDSRSKSNRRLHPLSKTQRKLDTPRKTNKRLHPQSKTNRRLHPPSKTNRRLHPPSKLNRSLVSPREIKERLHPPSKTNRRLHQTSKTNRRFHPPSKRNRSLDSSRKTKRSLDSPREIKERLHPPSKKNRSLDTPRKINGRPDSSKTSDSKKRVTFCPKLKFDYDDSTDSSEISGFDYDGSIESSQNSNIDGRPVTSCPKIKFDNDGSNDLAQIDERPDYSKSIVDEKQDCIYFNRNFTTFDHLDPDNGTFYTHQGKISEVPEESGTQCWKSCMLPTESGIQCWRSCLDPKKSTFDYLTKIKNCISSCYCSYCLKQTSFQPSYCKNCINTPPINVRRSRSEVSFKQTALRKSTWAREGRSFSLDKSRKCSYDNIKPSEYISLNPPTNNQKDYFKNRTDGYRNPYITGTVGMRSIAGFRRPYNTNVYNCEPTFKKKWMDTYLSQKISEASERNPKEISQRDIDVHTNSENNTTDVSDNEQQMEQSKAETCDKTKSDTQQMLDLVRFMTNCKARNKIMNLQIVARAASNKNKKSSSPTVPSDANVAKVAKNVGTETDNMETDNMKTGIPIWNWDKI